MTKTKYPSEKLDQYMLRLPDGMRDRIKDSAAANNRSMNAEIVAVLEKEYPAPELPTHRELLSRMLDFLIQEGAVNRTLADKEQLLSALDKLPEEVREDEAASLFQTIAANLDEKIAEYRRTHPAPSDDD